jgi:NAD(P)-dependent dehydrogenase (short-subunit alcohol dehydrogenase family)
MHLAPHRKALVTGGASGFGLEVSRRLVEAGADVALLDVSRERLESATRDLGDRTIAVPADVTSPAEVQGAVQLAAERLGGLDTVVISAGVIHIKPLSEVTEEDWDRTLDINLKGAFLTAQAAAPHLVNSGRGRMVMISSDAGRRGVPMLQAYSASKFGLVGLTESLASELAPAVTVNCVCPVGCPTTSMGQGVLRWKVNTTQTGSDALMARTAALNPLQRNATEADVAGTVCFFISEAGSFLTGVSLDVDGGARLNTLPGADQPDLQAGLT